MGQNNTRCAANHLPPLTDELDFSYRSFVKDWDEA
jgi:hypothetical protein